MSTSQSGTKMTTINTMQDLIQLLRDQPEWAEELRGILLSPELRDLPAAVRELAQALAASTAQANERLSNIEADIGVLKEDVGTLKGDVSTIQVQVNGLNGSDYERRAEAKALARSIADQDNLELAMAASNDHAAYAWWKTYGDAFHINPYEFVTTQYLHLGSKMATLKARQSC